MVDMNSMLAGPPSPSRQVPRGTSGQRLPKSITITGLDKDNEVITFTYTDGSKATNTLPELIRLGVSKESMMNWGAVLMEMAMRSAMHSEPMPDMMGGMPEGE